MAKPTFQSFFEDEMANIMRPVFPHRQTGDDGQGGHWTAVMWHQFASEAQAMRFSERTGQSAGSSMGISACERINYADAEMPKRSKRTNRPEPRLCAACLERGPLTRDEMLAHAIETVDEVFAAYDAKFGSVAR